MINIIFIAQYLLMFLANCQNLESQQGAREPFKILIDPSDKILTLSINLIISLIHPPPHPPLQDYDNSGDKPGTI